MIRPSPWNSIVTAVFCLTAATPWFDAASAGEVQQFNLGPPPSAARTERSYWIGTGASREEALALRDQLVAAGARNVNLFVPDMVIVCDVPVDVANAVARIGPETPFRPEKERDLLASPSRVANASWGWIMDSYALAERAPDRNAAPSVGRAASEAAFDDVVLTLSPERVDEIQREVAAARAHDVAGTRPPITRKSNQNSEFLGGYILANFILPESNGARDLNSESWSDDDLREARVGASAGLINWQRFGPRPPSQMAISWVVNFYERIPTGYEPITHDMSDDRLWIVDTMRSMGWGLFSDNPQPIVHEFNESERASWRTHWVVTSFIATSRNTPSYRFKSGSANYTAYAFLGGPFMVEPFPAGTDPNGIGETLVYSQIATHEIGHLFWTLDEYPGAPGVCTTRSGYLDISNGNVTMTDPNGVQARCEPLIPCIMHTATRLDQGRPWCEYSKGHLGVGDFNGNGYQDIFEAEPEIAFVPEGPETVTTNTYTLRFRAKANAVPNRNPYQGTERVSYALPLNGATLNLGSLRIDLDAVDERWDEIEEDCEFTVTLSQVGLVAFNVYAENEIKFKSKPTTKLVYFAGVRYQRVLALPKWNRMEVSWETRGETFGATFDVYRLGSGQSKPGTLVAQNVSPVGTSSEGQPIYKVHDFDVEPGRDYRYYVEGVFLLPYEGGMREYRSQSTTVGQIAMVQVLGGDLLSNVAPNPTHGAVTFSVAVPKTLTNTPRGPLRVPTNVDIRVYDVRGQLVRTLKNSSELNSVVTMRWDGTSQSGVPAPSGIYFLRVKAGDDEAIRKVVLLR